MSMDIPSLLTVKFVNRGRIEIPMANEVTTDRHAELAHARLSSNVREMYQFDKIIMHDVPLES